MSVHEVHEGPVIELTSVQNVVKIMQRVGELREEIECKSKVGFCGHARCDLNDGEIMPAHGKVS